MDEGRTKTQGLSPKDQRTEAVDRERGQRVGGRGIGPELAVDGQHGDAVHARPDEVSQCAAIAGSGDGAVAFERRERVEQHPERRGRVGGESGVAFAERPGTGRTSSGSGPGSSWRTGRTPCPSPGIPPGRRPPRPRLRATRARTPETLRAPPRRGAPPCRRSAGRGRSATRQDGAPRRAGSGPRRPRSGWCAPPRAPGPRGDRRGGTSGGRAFGLGFGARPPILPVTC